MSRGKNPKKDWKKFGNYEVEFKVENDPTKGFSVRYDADNGRTYYLSVPDDDKIRNLLSEVGRESRYLKNVLQCRAIPEFHKRDSKMGRKLVGLPQTRIKTPVLWEEVVEKVDDYWPQEKVGKFLRGENVILPTLTDFRRSCSRIYHSISEVHGPRILKDSRRSNVGSKNGLPLRAVLEKLRPGLYDILRRTNSLAGVEPEQIFQEYQRRFYGGEIVIPSFLDSSPLAEDRALVRKIRFLDRQNYPFSGKGNFYRQIKKRTGLTKKDIMAQSGSYKRSATLTERLAEFGLSWAFLLGIDLSEYFTPGDISLDKNSRTIYYDDKKGFADFRLKNVGVEVKSGVSIFNNVEISKMISKYSLGNSVWGDGEDFEGAVVVFMQREDLYRRHVNTLQDAEIKVMSYSVFREILEEVVGGIKREYSDIVGAVRPRVSSLDDFIRVSDDVALHPAWIFGENNRGRLNWNIAAVGGLIDLAHYVDENGKN